MEQPLTEGARRAIELSMRIAVDDHAAEATPLHLLWALVLEESRASEILLQYGLGRQTLQEAAPLADARGPVVPVKEADGLEFVLRTPAATSQSSGFHNVLFEARRRAALAGRHVEVGSEHLLFGLAAVDSPASEILRDHGVEPGVLDGRVDESSGFTAEPIATDVQLDLGKPPAVDRGDVMRILDAAANRAREGLRVLEDFTRFTLDDAHLTGLLKAWRHDFTQALQEIDAGELLAARDTQHDVGTSISTPGELRRESPREVVQANLKRVQEAVRTLEEFGKIASPAFAEQMGQLRYRLYTAEKSILLTLGAHRRLAGRCLYLLATEALCKGRFESVVREALAGGVEIVQLREKSLSDRELVERGHQVRRWTREAGALFIMNDRPDLAVLTDADGVHVGQDELTVQQARRIVGPDRLIGVSTHTIEQARRAVLDGADYLGVGPVFPSQTKHFDEFAGLDFVRQTAAEISLPWYAIGGISAANLEQVLTAGARRIAVSQAICGADDPATATRELRGRLSSKDE